MHFLRRPSPSFRPLTPLLAGRYGQFVLPSLNRGLVTPTFQERVRDEKPPTTTAKFSQSSSAAETTSKSGGIFPCVEKRDSVGSSLAISGKSSAKTSVLSRDREDLLFHFRFVFLPIFTTERATDSPNFLINDPGTAALLPTTKKLLFLLLVPALSLSLSERTKTCLRSKESSFDGRTKATDRPTDGPTKIVTMKEKKRSHWSDQIT